MRRGLIERVTAATIGTTDPTLAVSLDLPLVTDASCDYLLESTDSGLQLQILTNRNSRPLSG